MRPQRDGETAAPARVASRTQRPQVDAQEQSAPAADNASHSANALLRKARDELVAAGEALSATELAAAVFGATSTTPGAVAPWVAMVDRLLEPSPLFARDAAGLWRLTAWDVARRSLTDVEFVAVDVETTGLAPGRHRLIEVGAVIITGGAPGASFKRLINPDRRLPQFITKFTGITDSMVARAAHAGDVLPRLRAFIGDRPVVGHNIGFDLSFLNFEADRCGMGAAFPDEGIDTITLARRYVTGLRRAGLDRVAMALHLPVHTRHRALPDAVLTAEVFALLLARARESGCETLEDLWRALERTAPQRQAVSEPRPSGRMYLNPAWRKDFPTTPGVYLMRDASGEVIYVGKAKRLRDRLSSYYSQPLGYTRKMDGLLQNVVDIETRQLGSELDALLVESQLIKALQPRYNVQLKNHERYPFIKVDLNADWPRFYATREVSADGARYFGPFRSGRIVEVTLELVHKVLPLRTCTRNLPPDAPASEPCLRYHVKRCPGPCKGGLESTASTEYQAAVRDACAFLGGERTDLIDRLKREMFEAAARQDYERAARLRDALRDADQVLLGQRLITGAIEANNLLIAYPSAEAGAIELFLIRHGRLARQARVPHAHERVRSTAHEFARAAHALGAPPLCVGREEVDQINIVARWVSHHSDDSDRAFFSLPDDLDDETGIAAFTERVASIVCAPPEPPDTREQDELADDAQDDESAW